MNKCGTYAGYQTHVRKGEPTCDPCKKANRVYGAKYRRANPKVQERDREQAAAYRNAQAHLRERHRAEFDRIYAEELA